MKLASLLNHISVGGRVCRGRIGSRNIWGPSLLGADFVRGRVCQGPSLLGAEMSRNPLNYISGYGVLRFPLIYTGYIN